ncbi:cuticle protein-like [Lucilia cuprina]|uniref:cuticle protein-like n=1 Tax=Lucilia cuprina TaxID=7375 RepID=UPI001F0687F0|nr:cuticle protein-like [Lucilia cuprina]
MKFLIIISCLIACTMAQSYLYPVPLQQLQTPLLVVKTQQQPGLQFSEQQQQPIQQYFTQDTLGQYSYGYSEPLSTKQEIRTLDGVTTGSYSYIDANNLLQTVDYIADDNGFHVVATNLPKDSHELPQSVQETSEVAAARAEHLAAHKAILEGNPSASSILPKPVEDTTEVAEAKREFFARYSAEQEKQKLLQKSVLLRNKPIAVTAPLRPVQPTVSPLKIKPADIKSSSNLKTYLTPGIGGFRYGYQIAGAIKPTHYYLPVA